MSDIVVVTESELRKSIGLDEASLSCVEDCFAALARGGVVMPPILRLDIAEHQGEVDVKTAYVPGLESFAIKISPGFFDNPKLGLPSLNGLMVLFDAKTGLVKALLLDNGYLTAIRTAAAGAVAARHLSREDAKTVTILGTGAQARLQLKALTLVRPIEKICYWGADADKAEKTAGEMAAETGLEVLAMADPAQAVADADIIVTATAATRPILKWEWLKKGQHITAMGSDAEHKNELDPGIIKEADSYVADSLSQTARLGELHHAIEAGLVSSRKSFAELGEVIVKEASARVLASDITVADLTGTGVQDTAIATLAYSRIASQSLGEIFKNQINAS